MSFPAFILCARKVKTALEFWRKKIRLAYLIIYKTGAALETARNVGFGQTFFCWRDNCQDCGAQYIWKFISGPNLSWARTLSQVAKSCFYPSFHHLCGVVANFDGFWRAGSHLKALRQENVISPQKHSLIILRDGWRGFFRECLKTTIRPRRLSLAKTALGKRVFNGFRVAAILNFSEIRQKTEILLSQN